MTKEQALECIREGQASYSAYERQPIEQMVPQLHRAIELYRAALTVLTAGTAPKEWATAMHSLGNAFRILPGSGQQANLELAVTCYNAALSVFTRTAFPAQWAATMTNLGAISSSLGALDNGDFDSGNLKRAVSCFEAALTVRSEAATPGPWSLTQHNLGNAYLRLAQAGDSEAAWSAIAAYQAALRVRTREAAPLQWARTIVSLADACLCLPENIRAEQLPAVMREVSDALTFLTREATPAEWSNAHLALANAYFLATTGDRNENLEKAVAHFDAGLPLLISRESRAQRFHAEATLADALVELERGDRRRNLLRAIALYRDWLANAGPGRTAERADTLAGLGSAYEATGDLDSAVGSYEQGLALLVDGSESWARMQKRLGDALSQIGLRGSPKTLQRAIACYEGALGKLDPERHPESWATAQLNLGNALSRLGGLQNLRDAIAHFEAALRIDTQERAPVRWANIQHSLGATYGELSDGDRSANLKRAKTFFESALRVFTETETPDDWARTQSSLGKLRWEARKLEGTPAVCESAAYFENALHIWTKEQNPIDWAKTKSLLGVVWANLAASDEEARRALNTCAEALTVFTQNDYPVGWALSQYNMGSCYLHLRAGNREENIQATLSCFGLAASVLDRAGSPLHWAALQMDSGAAYAQLHSGNRERNLGQALACFAAALAVYNEQEYPAEWAAAQANIGAAQIELEREGVTGSTAEGVKALESALRILTPDSSPTLWTQAQMNLGTALAKQDPERARECYEAALRVLTPASDSSLWAMAQGLLGGLYATRSDKPDDQRRAIECFERQLSVVTSESNPWKCMQVTTQLAFAHFYNEQWTEAVKRYLEAAALAERLRSVSGDASTRLRVLRDSLSVFDRGMLAAAHAEQYELALEFAERGKARNLADQLRRADYQPRSASAEEWGRYQDLLREIDATRPATTSAVFDRGAATTYESALARLFKLRQEAAELEKRFMNADPEYALFDQPLDSTRLCALAKTLEAVIVDFRLTAEGSYAFLAGPDGKFTAQNAIPLGLVVTGNPMRWSRQFSGFMSAQGIESGQDESLAGDMYKLVMKPVRERLRERYPSAKRLVLVPSRGLTLLPLQAARLDPDEGSGYLLDEYEIAWAPNCSILERCALRAATAAKSPSLMAVQDPDNSLSFADWEVEEIAKLFPADARRVIAGSSATRDAVAANLSFGSERLFSCHAAFDAEAPEKSNLRLADGILNLPDLLRADFRNASLIVMSACTSGVVDLQTLDVDEHFGLATACLVSGAQTVVASLWKVNDVATALLMQRFHRNLYAERMGKARALQEAQIWLRDMDAEEAYAILEARQADCEDGQSAADAAQALLDLRDRGPKPFAHPYWWAAFQCVGSGWEPPLQPTTPGGSAEELSRL